MKKTALLLVIVLIASMFVLGSCDLIEKIPGAGDLLDKYCTHSDADKNHVCDDCEVTISECKDKDNDHNCDYCGNPVSECLDADKDHNCDVCGESVSKHGDGNSDHICDGCGTSLSECTDANKDHVCDLCGKTLSECADKDKDHACDHCGTSMGEHVAVEGSHLCDYCGKAASDCVDAEKDHVCDICGADIAECADLDGDHLCDYCEKALSECADENKDHNCDICEKPLSECKDENKDHNCDVCEKPLSECADEDKDHNCDVCEKPLSECADEDKDHVCDYCGKPVGEHVEAEGSHTCGYCGQVISECKDEDKNHNCDLCEKILSECADSDNNYSCDVCGADMIPDTHEKVEYSLNISDLEAKVHDVDVINGRFTIVAGSEIRNRTKTFEGVEYTKSVKIGNNTTKINVSVPGTGKLSFLIQNGSSGAAMQFVTVTAPDGTVYDIEFLGTDGGSPVVKIELDVTEGEWVISRGKNGGTQDVFALELSCVVEKSDENGFEIVSEGTVDYLCGQQLDLSGIKLNGTYANGKTEPLALSDVTIDSSAVDMSVSGTYPVTISYKNYAPLTVNINVYQPASVQLGFDGTVQKGQSSFGNGMYINQSFKEIYAVGDTLDLTGLYVAVEGRLGEETKLFSNLSTYVVGEVDLSTAGPKEVIISYVFGEEKISETAYVYVVDTAPSIVEDAYQVKVDQSYSGTIGAVEGGYNMFTTVQQALDFLASSEAGKRKIMIIEEGLYTEKLEITIPNLHIKGVGADKVTIEWDSIYGIKDAGGFSQVTDSTQTVAIRDTAYGVTIEGITISNYWNSQERMDAAGLAIERGLALLVQADRFIMKDSALLGIQDTLELFTGRQYFENVFISGYTDFIFGTNNTTLFKNCTIHVIDTTKDDSGTAGYLTAFKGSNKGSQDAITYGAIFYQCKFTADEGVTEGKTAIGRTWGAYAAVAVIESEIGGHISLDGYDSSNNKNKRYISMNGIHPTDETVQFVEFGNTGAGAITEAVAGMKMLTAEEAALYIDIATIFGKNNRNVSWLDAWDPSITEIVLDDRTYYNFDQSTSEGTSHTFDINTTIGKGKTLEWAGLLISAENGSVAWNSNANALNMKTGAFIKFTVPAGTEVTVITYPSYNYFTLNGVGTASANMLSQYYAEETEVTLLSTGDLYIYQIIINPDEEAPAAPTLSEIKVSGFNPNYVVGDEISLEGVVVKAIYSDNSVREVSYEVDASAVDNTAAGVYEIVFTYEGKTATVKVTYEDPNAGPEITKDTVLDFTTPEGLEEVQNNPKVTIDGSVRHNGAEIQITGTISFQVKAGTVVSVIPYGNSSYVSYKIYAVGEENDIIYSDNQSVMFFKDCTVVYTGLENNYLVSISIQCPLAEGKYVFGGSTEEGDVTGILESIPGMSVSGTCNTHTGGAQLGANSQIIFIAPGLATVTIQGFDTNYGQLRVLVDGESVEMNDKAQYVINLTSAATVIIEALNVGTEEAPAWNKSYITYIDVDMPVIIEENTEITFGGEGNYKDSVVDFSGITIEDNGGNNSQIKNGSFSFAVREGAIVTVHGYSGYTSYNLGDGDIVYEGLTDEYFTYEAWNDCVITISHTTGNNYFYSISIVYPVVFEENTTIDLSATNGFKVEGSTANYEGLEIDATNGKFADNGSGWVQINAGTVIKLNVLDGAEVSVKTYKNEEIFTIEIVDGVCTLTCTAGGYLGAITVNYPIVYDEATTIDLSATGANIQGSVGVYEGLTVDATTGKFADNGGGWVQVNTGTVITFNVADGAQVSVSAYSSSDSFTVAVADGVCTITAVANDYLNGITIAY